MAKSAVLFPWLDVEGRNQRIRRWSTQLLAICGVQVELPAGSVPALARAMVVANHVSWLDIFVINAVHPCRFVAKAEIRSWPLLGWRKGGVFPGRDHWRAGRHPAVSREPVRGSHRCASAGAGDGSGICE